MAGQKLPKARRLCGRDRIGELFGEGSRGVCGTILARALRNPGSESRLAAVAGKALGNAVKRNRMRRRIRAAVRLQMEALPEGWDFVLLARAGLVEASWQDVMRDVKTAAERAVSNPPGDARTCGRRPRRQSR